MEKKRANKLVLIAYFVCCMALFIAYTAELIKGFRQPWYLVVLSILLFVPYVLTYYGIYRKDNGNILYSKLAMIGFMIPYLFVLFTANLPIIVVYIVPLFATMPILHDYKFCGKVAICSVVANTIQVIIMGTNHFSSEWLAQAEVQMAFIIFVGLTITFMSRIDTASNKEKIDGIEKSQKEAEEKTEEVISMMNNINEAVKEININIGSADEKIVTNVDAMRQVCEGTNITVEEIQKEITEIEVLSNGISEFKTIADSVAHDVSEASDAVHRGTAYMEELNEIVASSDQYVNNVKESFVKLVDSVEKIREITEVIAKISNQTKLLSLNASIEAARAGEAGRGFTVVAEEIGKLSSETTKSLSKVDNCVNEVSSGTQYVDQMLNQMLSAFERQKDMVKDVDSELVTVMNSIVTLGSSFGAVTESAITMDKAKDVIMNSMENISSISEETTANAVSTSEQLSDIKSIMEQIYSKVSGLTS